MLNLHYFLDQLKKTYLLLYNELSEQIIHLLILLSYNRTTESRHPRILNFQLPFYLSEISDHFQNLCYCLAGYCRGRM